MTTDLDITRAISALAAARGDGSFCPSEVARALAPEWRALMPQVRSAAARMPQIMATQRGVEVDPVGARGPIRLRRRPD